MAKKITTPPAAKNRPGDRPAPATPEIYYKGERLPLVVTNSVLMRFKRLGGDLSALEADPVSGAITLVCAALKLTGDPIDHADDFPPVAQFAAAITGAIQRYNGDASTPGETIGD